MVDQMSGKAAEDVALTLLRLPCAARAVVNDDAERRENGSECAMVAYRLRTASKDDCVSLQIVDKQVLLCLTLLSAASPALWRGISLFASSIRKLELCVCPPFKTLKR